MRLLRLTAACSCTSRGFERRCSPSGARLRRPPCRDLTRQESRYGQVARGRAVEVQADRTLTINTRLVALKSMGQLELDIAAAEVQKAKADVAAAEAVASKCSISAPFAGVTVEQKAREFQYTTPGQALLDIVDNRHLEVELIAPSRWLSWLKTGYGFQVRVEETDKIYPARITRLGGRVDPVSQSIKVIGVITGEAPELTAGMSGRAIILPPS